MIGRSTFGIACLAVVTVACYPGRSVDATSEFVSVTTLYDKAAPFEAITKYALPDTVLYVPRKDKEEVPAATQSAILSQIRTNLAALGWQEVINARTTPVDVYVVAAVTSTTYIGWVYDWWGYWGWYPYWPVGWGANTNWYYPPYWYAYSYTTGTVVLGMIDGRPQASGQQVPLVWSAGVNGVLDGQAANITIATAGINQAFQQSPYLSEGVQP